MIRKLLLICILTITLTAISHSFDPPWQSPPYPWGRDTTEWVWKKIPSGPIQAYYNPEEEMFQLCGGEPVEWPTLLVELFIEMELEFDFGNIYPQSTDGQLDFIDHLYLHGIAQSEIPAQFRIITMSGNEFIQRNLTKKKQDSNSNQPAAELEWEISTDGGHSYKKLKGYDNIRFYKFDSWYNPFIVKVAIQPEKNFFQKPIRLNVEAYPLPQN